MRNRKEENIKIRISNYLDRWYMPNHTQKEIEQLKELVYKQYLFNKETKSGISLNMLLNTLHYEWANYEQALAELNETEILNETAK